MEYAQHIFKILPPQLPEVLERPRLIESLERNRCKKLCLILGQAAQGKSTLVASYVRKCGIPTAWVNLEPEDSEAVNLYLALNHALNYALQEAGGAPLPPCSAASVGPRDETSVYREWARSLLEPLSMPLQIVLDGADQLLPDAPSFRFIRILLDQLPTNIHLLVLSRETPPLDVPELKMKREAEVLGNDELAFTPAEVQDFFCKVCKMPLSSEQLHKFHRTTEGWIGGLIILAESLNRLSRGKAAESIFKVLPDYFEREVFEYFAEEVFASLPIDIKDFLIRSSVLYMIEPGIAGELTGNEKVVETLDTLARRNLFVQSIYVRGKGWLFRYHQLFREFLQAKLGKDLDERVRRDLFLKAGSLYEKCDQLEDAVKVYLEGKAYPQAVSVMQQAGMKLVAEGRLEELAGWTGAVPAELIEKNRWLLFYRYMSRRFANFQECLPYLMKAYDLCREDPDVKCSLLFLAYLIEASVTKGHSSIPAIDLLLSQAESLVQSSASAQHPHERAVLYLQMGFGHLLKLGDPRNGIRACQNAYLLARELGDLPLQISASINVHFCHSTLGELANAREVMKRVETLLAKYSSPELRALHLINSSQLHWFDADFERMRQCLQRAGEEIEQHGINYLVPVCMLYEVSFKRQAGMCAEAAETGENLARLTFAAGNMWLHGNALLQTGLAYYFTGQTHKARELYEQAREILSAPESRGDFHSNCTNVALALVACRLRTDKDAEAKLAHTIRDWQEKGVHIFLKEAHLAMALLKWRQGAKQEAAENLAAGLNLARERGFHLNLLLNREDMLGVFIMALELGLENQWDYASRCLKTDLADLAEPELKRLTGHENPKIAGKAQEMAVAIHRRRSPRLRIETLGGFRISRGDSLIEEAEWEGSQPKLLLKALIAGGCRNVAKDLLIEALWPEISASAGDRNFRVILHRLRKTLEPSMDKEFGSSYVHLKANLVSLDQELCSVDVEEFLSLREQAGTIEIEGDTKKALALCEEAMKVYRGEFLAEELYQPWARTKRENLHSRYIELLFRTADFYEQQRKTKKAIEAYRKIVTADPLEEQACQRLMILYFDRGMRNEALKAYETCKCALEEELGTAPDELTELIHRKIVESGWHQHPPDAK